MDADDKTGTIIKVLLDQIPMEKIHDLKELELDWKDFAHAGDAPVLRPTIKLSFFAT